jgi:formylglycine-generating enzyme required for sulfatase activity
VVSLVVLLGPTLPLALAQDVADSTDLLPGGAAIESLDRPPCRRLPGQGPEMVLIEAGTFAMGSPPDEAGRYDDESPQRQVVVVEPFAIGRCEVTVAEFRTFVEAEQYATDAETSGGCYRWDLERRDVVQDPALSWRNPGFPQGDAHPVTCVSWNDAKAYAAWLSDQTGQTYRLPTEAEWEYAARAGTTTARFWGDVPAEACAFANVADQSAQQRFPDFTVHDCDDGAVFTAPVGSYTSNLNGLSDMLGNVVEWVEDCWHESYRSAPPDGAEWLEANEGDCSRRVLRGGSWSNGPVDVRSAYRNRSSPR